ncbi:MAG: 3TM-type holin [Alphaproteobacteria bacterium]
MLSAFLSQMGLPVLISVVCSVLGALDNPVAKTASKALEDVSETIKSGGISPEQLAEANRHTEAMADLEMKNYQTTLSEINKSLRAEVSSSDKYVRRMRPTFGYLMAFTWAAQMLGVAYVIIFDTSKSGMVMAAMGNLSAIWAVGLSVLGIYVYKRSEDKRAFSVDERIYWND